MTQSVKHLTHSWFPPRWWSQGHETERRVGLLTQEGVCLGVSLSLSLPLPTLELTLVLSINKILKKKGLQPIYLEAHFPKHNLYFQTKYYFTFSFRFISFFHFSNYCPLANFPVYKNHCYMDKIYSPFRKTYTHFEAIIIKHRGHSEMGFGATETKRQNFHLFFLTFKT